MTNDCIFCKIVKGEIPSHKVYEDDKTLAFLDINPVHAGHTLVIPKEHSRNIFEIAEDDWVAVQKTVHRVAQAIEKSLDKDGVNLLMNNREHAGQVVDHSHVHLIPRHRGDGGVNNIWTHHPIREEETGPILEKIRAAL